MGLQTLHQELKSNLLSFCRNVDEGYFLLSSNKNDMIQYELMLSPFKSKWEICMLQSWVPGFSPDNPSNLAFSTWISLPHYDF